MTRPRTSADRSAAPRTGPSWFGPAYAAMIRRDPHAPGTVDRRLLSRMVGLDARSATHLYSTYSPTTSSYRAGTRPRLERIVRRLAPVRADAETVVRSTARYFAERRTRLPVAIDDLKFGGTEEEIVARRSDWCTDVSRAACACLQTAGLAARMVFLADTRAAYSGHAIVEAYRQGTWGAVDALSGTVYARDDGSPATTWDIMRDPRLVSRSAGAPTRASDRGSFRAAAICNYRLVKRRRSAYRVTSVSPYYRSILEMSDKGWPGGLRWLHGEDRPSSPHGIRPERVDPMRRSTAWMQ